MKNPIKINKKKLKNEILEISFSFPKDAQSSFKEQLRSFWNAFNQRTSKIEELFIRLTKHIQSVKATDAQLKPYIEIKTKIVQALSEEVNNFINISEDSSKNLVKITNMTKKEIEFSLKCFNDKAELLKTAYKYEHLYLQEMTASFNKLKEQATLIFSTYGTVVNQIKDCSSDYEAKLRINASKNVKVEELLIQEHEDFGRLTEDMSLFSFIKNCLELAIIEDFKECDGKIIELVDSFIVHEYFNSHFKEQVIDVSSYISEYQRTIKIAQELSDLDDYRIHFKAKSPTFKNRSVEVEMKLKELWMQFSAHYSNLFTLVQNNKAASSKLKKQVLNISLKDFFSLDKNKILEQAITDVSVDDFEESVSFVTWEIINKEDLKFCTNFKNNFYKKYADKFDLEIIQPGVFFKEEESELSLVFISINQDNNLVKSFIKKIETKYQKKAEKIKSVQSQKLSDFLTVSYGDSKISVPLEYHFFKFRDPALLQGLKKLESL